MKDHPSQWIASGLTCRAVTGQASDYLENRLAVLSKIRVGVHLASCTDCRAYLKQVAVVSETLPRLPKPYPPAISRLRLRRHFAALHSH